MDTEVCPNCFQTRGGADWHTLWTGGFTCQRVMPFTVGDVIPDENGQRLTTEFGFYSKMETLKTEDGYCILPHNGDEEDDTLLFLTDY